LQQPFFFLFGPTTPLLLDRSQPADSFVHADQILAELLESMKLGDLLLGLAEGGWVGKGFRHRLSGHSASQAELGIMSGIVRLGAMAGRFAAASRPGGNATRPKITQAEELLQEIGSFGFQGGEVINHRGSFCAYLYAQNDAIKKGSSLRATSMSPTQVR
jgi:hypothetical protein